MAAYEKCGKSHKWAKSVMDWTLQVYDSLIFFREQKKSISIKIKIKGPRVSKRVRVSCLEGHFKDFGDLGQVGSKIKLTKNQEFTEIRRPSSIFNRLVDAIIVCRYPGFSVSGLPSSDIFQMIKNINISG